jgi:electron transfer flavoprotein alpha/beta subunit
MIAVNLIRMTMDPKDSDSLILDGEKVTQLRPILELNESDIKAMTLIKGAKLTLKTLSIGPLDNIIRTHTFVRGAETIEELGTTFVWELPEEAWAHVIAQRLLNEPQIAMFGCGSNEQDSGRTALAGLVAGALNWEFFSGVIAIEPQDHGFSITQETDEGTQTLFCDSPFVFTPSESCELGDDPSDEYDLMEKLEKKTSTKISDADCKKIALTAPLTKECYANIPTKPAQEVLVGSPEVVARICDLLLKQKN